MGCDTQLAVTCLFMPTFVRRVILIRQCLEYDQGSLVDLCVQDCKSLSAQVTICVTLVNIQTYSIDQFV